MNFQEAEAKIFRNAGYWYALGQLDAVGFPINGKFAVAHDFAALLAKIGMYASSVADEWTVYVSELSEYS
jgi:hypothetical protein